jgi:hypothetical protein
VSGKNAKITNVAARALHNQQKDIRALRWKAESLPLSADSKKKMPVAKNTMAAAIE